MTSGKERRPPVLPRAAPSLGRKRPRRAYAMQAPHLRDMSPIGLIFKLLGRHLRELVDSRTRCDEFVTTSTAWHQPGIPSDLGEVWPRSSRGKTPLAIKERRPLASGASGPKSREETPKKGIAATRLLHGNKIALRRTNVKSLDLSFGPSHFLWLKPFPSPRLRGSCMCRGLAAADRI